MQITGIDASYAQASFDWKSATNQGLQFAYCTRSKGTAGVDPVFDYHWAGIKAQNVVRGAYHFSRWDLGTDPTAEAQFFLSKLPALEVSDFVVLDIENSPDRIPGRALSSWALAWLSVVEHALGFKPMVYSGAYFASQFLTDPRLTNYGLCVAAYGPECPTSGGPWQIVAMWQHTNQAVYCGMNVDEDYFFGSVDQLRAYGKPAPVAPSAGEKGKAPRFLVTKDMMARTSPNLAAVRFVKGRLQMVYRGAVLNGTGKQTANWVQVIAGGLPTWMYLPNTRPV
jgi:lysozyme